MEGMAQTKYQQPIVWREAGMLSTINNEQPNIGLSGIITGIIGGQLLIGGGNNFPAGFMGCSAKIFAMVSFGVRSSFKEPSGK